MFISNSTAIFSASFLAVFEICKSFSVDGISSGFKILSEEIPNRLFSRGNRNVLPEVPP